MLILTIAVAVRDRPATAPPEVTEDFGWTVVGSPTFLTGLAASTVIFISSSGHSAFIPMIAEMKNPKVSYEHRYTLYLRTYNQYMPHQDYKKPIAATMSLLSVSYLVFSLVIFRYCGRESSFDICQLPKVELT